MDENDSNDIKIINIKNKKTSGSEKKKTIKRKGTNKSFKSSNNKSSSSKNYSRSHSKKHKNTSKKIKAQSLEITKPFLDKIQEMIIEQEPDVLEAVMGCQQPNNYRLYGKLHKDEKYYIFKIREFSSCGMRCCCPISCRKLIMKIKISLDENNNDNDEEFNNNALYIEKKFKCPCCNCVRPEMCVFISESNTLLGKIEEGFSCCDPIFNVYDKEGILLYNIETNCCQCGFMCRNNTCGKTDECIFFIYDNNDKSNPIGSICKKGAISQLSIADNYSVIFPKNANFEQKILLSIAGVMIDYQYFEKNANTVR